MQNISRVFVFLFLLTGPCTVSFTFIAGNRLHYLYMQQSGADRGKEERFVLPAREYKKSQHRRNEIMLQGRMYDIRHAKYRNGKVWITAVRDSGEEKMKRSFAGYLRHANRDPKNHNTSGKLISFSLAPFLPADSVSSGYALVTASGPAFPEADPGYLIPDPDNTSPPPKG